METSIVLVLLAVAILILCAWIFILEMRLSRIFRGRSAASLEDTIAQGGQNVEQLRNEFFKLEDKLKKIDERVSRKVETVKTLRFNPFQGTGGNHSFASSLIDEHGDGVVISTLYSREKVSIFAKPVKGRVSDIELTEEEAKVLSSK